MVRLKVVFIAASLAASAALGGALYKVWREDRDGRIERFISARAALLREMAFAVETAAREQIAEVTALAEDPYLGAAMAERSGAESEPGSARRRLAESILAVCRSRPQWHEAVVLDSSGMEIVAVRREASGSGHVPRIASGAALKNRSKEPWRADAMKTKRGGFFASPIGLAKEDGRLVFPLRPSIRFAVPVYGGPESGGALLGIVAVESRAEWLLKSIYSPEGNEVSLVDPEGYFIIHPDSRLCWGKELAESTGAPPIWFETIYPGDWARMTAAGGDWCETERAILVFRPIAIGNREMRLVCRIPRAYMDLGSSTVGWLAGAMVVHILLSTAFLMWISAREAAERRRAADNEEMRRLAEERNRALEDARKASEEANAAKSRFLASVSHELRTPLTSIIGFAEILRDYPDLADEEKRKMVNTIVESSHHLLSLVNAVLDLAKIEAGKMSVKLGAVPVRDFSEVCVSTIQGIANKRQVHVSCDVNGAPEWAMLDERHVREILFNLMGNAVKFTDAGGRVTLTVDMPDGNIIRFRVSDTGCGIPPDKLKNLFRPFAQVEEAQKGRPRGTGLGLAISRDLAVRMGGDLVAESEPGKGSTFTMILPYVEPPEADKRKSSEKKFIPDAPLEASVAVFDDDENIRRLISMHLRLWGCRVKEYADASRLADALADPPDVVVCDINMPEGGGVELARRLRMDPQYSRIAVVACTASVLEHQVADLMKTGLFEDVVPKPVEWGKLYSVLKNAVGKKRAADAGM